MDWSQPEIRDAVRRALKEDIGSGDVTTAACVPADAEASGYFLSRESFPLAGLPLLELIYDQEEVETPFEDSELVAADVIIARVRGKARRLLTLERTALNFLQRTCGIAAEARRFVAALSGTNCRPLDTRKTTPGLRLIEKLSVRAGGAVNHRVGLWDAVLIKNNHITAAGGVREAFERCRAAGLPVEIEVRSRAELEEALAIGADHLLLDNFMPDEVREAVRQIDGRAKIEASGGITVETARAYAEAGADFVSAGAMTHSARAVDISFRIE